MRRFTHVFRLDYISPHEEQLKEQPPNVDKLSHVMLEMEVYAYAQTHIVSPRELF